jgi:hypothetical protein
MMPDHDEAMIPARQVQYRGGGGRGVGMMPDHDEAEEVWG